MEVSSGLQGASIKRDFYWRFNSISRIKNNDKKGDQGVFFDPLYHRVSLEFPLKKFPAKIFNDFQIARLVTKMCLWELF